MTMCSIGAGEQVPWGQHRVSTHAREQQKREREMVALRHRGFLCAPLTGAAVTIRRRSLWPSMFFACTDGRATADPLHFGRDDKRSCGCGEVSLRG